MASIASTAERARAVLTDGAERRARGSGCVQRQRVFDGALLVQTVVLGFWARPRATVHQLTQVAAQLGVRVSPQGIDQRFDASLAACLERVLGAISTRVGTRASGVSALLERFTGVSVLDTTAISLPEALAAAFPGCGGGHGGGEAAIKLAVLLELGSGTLAGSRTAPWTCRTPPCPWAACV